MAKNIRKALVQRARLALIGQVGEAMCNAVGEFMREYIQLRVAIAKLENVTVGVIVGVLPSLPNMHVHFDVFTIIVIRIVVEAILPVGVDRLGVVEGIHTVGVGVDTRD